MIPGFDLGKLRGPAGSKDHIAMCILSNEVAAAYEEHREEVKKDRNGWLIIPEFIGKLLEKCLKTGDITPGRPRQLGGSNIESLQKFPHKRGQF